MLHLRRIPTVGAHSDWGSNMGDVNEAVILARLKVLKPVTIAALLRIGRRIEEGFEGEIQLSVKSGGVHHLRWTQTETGNVIKEEIG